MAGCCAEINAHYVLGSIIKKQLEMARMLTLVFYPESTSLTVQLYHCSWIEATWVSHWKTAAWSQYYGSQIHQNP